MSVRARKPVNTVVTKAAAYDTILRPIITEKATMANENGQVTFAVAMTATKPEIKAAVELLFDVKVVAVNMIV
jgi:large subunit ribosomal protein L23